MLPAGTRSLKEKKIKITSRSKPDDHHDHVNKVANEVGKRKLLSPLASLLPRICVQKLPVRTYATALEPRYVTKILLEINFQLMVIFIFVCNNKSS